MSQNSFASDERLTWAQVQAMHGSRRGIRVTAAHSSILLDFGLSPYVNRREGLKLFYEGEGRQGDQTPTGGNAGLLACFESGRAVVVFERVSSGQWYWRGPHWVTDVTYRLLEFENRMVYEFCLEPFEN